MHKLDLTQSFYFCLGKEFIGYLVHLISFHAGYLLNKLHLIFFFIDNFVTILIVKLENIFDNIFITL